MKGNEQILAKLNELLADELTAINQYMVHSEMCDNWGYERLHKKIEERAIVEMKHAEKLIARILFFDEGRPIVSNLNAIHIGADVQGQLRNDLQAEYDAVATYNHGVRLAADLHDNGTRDILEEILEDEEEHVDWIEAQLDQIEHVGIQNYLVMQVEG
jgi:bacterioferritin